ncbi:MAG: AAA family ATPase [Campylobacterales bacterium]
MRIKSIQIYNYRSIKYVELPTIAINNKVCSILLGKNESGKSNILKAISLLGKYAKVDYNLDCNKEAKKNSEAIVVRYELDFYHDWWRDEIIKKGFPAELIDIAKITRVVEIDIDGKNDYFEVKLYDKDEYKNYVIANNSVKIEKVSDVYSGAVLLTKNNIAELLPDYKILTKERLGLRIAKDLFTTLDYNTPKVLFWEPSSKYLINEAIKLSQFKADTSISIPLRNIFYIAQINEEDIAARIGIIETDDEERMELSQLLSEEITKYINSKWNEHKINITVTIEKNLECSVIIEDKDNSRPKYKMEQRSDGFKQFMSILLNLSAENNAEVLKNRLILLDEPEVHLHPSGIKYLREELLKISENNNVVIATHSTYMVDKLNLNRHFSVSKEKSLTNIVQIEENNPYEEEVIFESLGTSIFEIISPNVILFEGKTDKDIFDAFMGKFKSELGVKLITAISANGVNNIVKYVKFFNVSLIKGFVVVDSDKEGKETKKIVIRDNDAYNENNVFELSDLISLGHKSFAMEDLLPKEVIEVCLMEEFELNISLNGDDTYFAQIKSANKTIDEKQLKSAIVNYVISDISKKGMTKEKTKTKYSLYFSFVSGLISKVN